MRLFRSLLGLSLLAVCAYGFVPFLQGWMREWIGIPVMWGVCVVLPGYALWRFTRPLGDDVIESIARVLLNGLIFLFVLCFAWALTGVSLDAFRAALPLLIIALCATVPGRDKTRIEVVKPRLRRYEKQLLILFAV